MTSTVAMPVSAVARSLIITFTMRIELDSGLVYDHIDIDGRIWTGDVVVSENNTVSLTYIRSDARTAHHGTSLSEQSLFIIYAYISADVAASSSLAVTAEVLYASDVLDNVVFSSSTPAVVISRDGTSFDSIGNMYYAAEALVGLIAFPREADLVNTAVLNGISVSSAVTVIGVFSTGVTHILSSGVTCVSSLPSVVQVDAACRQVTMSGTETSGGSGVLIVLHSGAVAASFSVNVWYPTLPVSMALSRAVLRPIFGWMNSSSSGCRNVYQRATMSASATFNRPGSAACVADVTSVVSQVLSVSNGSVAFLDKQLCVAGLKAGASSVVATVNGIVIGRAAFLVDASKLSYAIALSVLPVQSVSRWRSRPRRQRD